MKSSHEYDDLNIELRPVPVQAGSRNPFGAAFREFPWQAQFDSIKQGARRNLLAVYLDGVVVGGMTVDEHESPPHLIFFEIIRSMRGRGIGRRALLALVDRFLSCGRDHLYIQTGRTEIYSNMGFRFRSVARSGLVIDLRHPVNEYADKPESPLTIVYDDRHRKHSIEGLPEAPGRVELTLDYLGQRKILSELAIVPPRYADVARLSRLHDQDYIEFVAQACRSSLRIAPDVATVPETYDVARLAFGGALLAGEYLGEWGKVFVLCRPPGHHALRNHAMGFCFFNNMAGLALFLHEQGIQPFVVDWDAHHGNGTQELLYHLPIPFISYHQRDLFPWSGLVSERGEGPGQGYTYNVPLPPLCDDRCFVAAFARLKSLIAKHRPDVLLVSAGQDGHQADQFSGMRLSTECYRFMGRTVADLADRYTGGRLVLLLEGGYSEYAGEATGAVVEGVLGIGNIAVA